MGVEAEKSDQIIDAEASPIVMAGRHTLYGDLRIAYFKHTQLVTGALLSTVALAKLPPGNVRLLGLLCALRHNWTIDTVDMDIGWLAYTDLNGDAVAADEAGLDADLDVDTAGIITIGSELASVCQQKVFQSKAGVTIQAKAKAVGITAGDTVEGYLIYV